MSDEQVKDFEDASEDEVIAETTEATYEEGAAAESQPASLEEQLASAQAEMADYKDQWLRARAEFANARKRLERERLEAYGNATLDVIAKLLPVLDDFDRAAISVPAAVAEDSWFEGIELVYRKLNSILENLNIERIPTVGEPFDPTLHEAVMREETDEFESGTVCKELQPGYRRADRVIRPALVSVAG